MTVFKTILFLILVPGALLFWAPLKMGLFRPGGSFYMESLRCAAFLPWSVGTVILLWSCWEFVFRGRGTPAPIDPPKFLVAGGGYRFVRNPMYLGAALILLGHVLWFQSLRLLIFYTAIQTAFHLFVVFYEEPHLRRKFGKSFEDYCRQTPRWLPRLKGLKRSYDKQSAPE